MHLRSLLTAGALVLLLAFAVAAADIDGKWKAEFEGPNGNTITSIFSFKVDGSKLTGTVEGRRGPADIQEGKVNGDEISFVVIRKFNDQEFKQNYKGKVAGSEIKFTVEMGDRNFEMTAKKQ
jgi:hypothetical protein